MEKGTQRGTLLIYEETMSVQLRHEEREVEDAVS